MRILIVAATKLEIKPALDFFTNKKSILSDTNLNTEISFLITGIGIANTTYHLTKQLSINKYDLVINAGIAGSFSQKLRIGTIVNIVSDEFADLGIEDNNKFHTLFDMKFIEKNNFPFTNGKLINKLKVPEYFNRLQNVTAITVHKASGCKATIARLKQKHQANIESMEGAAFCFVCLNEKIPFLQIRSISNFIEPRNRKNWNIALAIKNLNEMLIEMQISTY